MKREPIYTEFPDGTKEWRLDGERHREDGPAMIHANGSELWYHYGIQHRDGGPAITWLDGTEVWYIKGKCHRIDGPAVVWPHRKNTWWINHVEYNFNVWCAKMKLSPEKIIEMKLLYG